MRFFIFFLSLFSSLAFANQELVIEPDLGRAPILSFISDAEKSIDLVMYGFTDSVIADHLISAKKQNKNIRVLLEPYPYKTAGENDAISKKLQSANIKILTPHPDVKLTHQKTLMSDQNRAMIMTFNFTHSTFSKERNFALVIDDPAMVSEIIRVFNADVRHKHISVSQPNLVWSPNNSREKILDFINHADSEIKIYAQDITDYQVIGALAKAARAGKKVAILTNEPKPDNHSKKYAYLRKAGVIIHFSKSYRIHAKVIMIDKKRAMLGSINLTRASINDNRELAVITQQESIITQLIAMFDHDF